MGNGTDYLLTGPDLEKNAMEKCVFALKTMSNTMHYNIRSWSCLQYNIYLLKILTFIENVLTGRKDSV